MSDKQATQSVEEANTEELESSKMETSLTKEQKLVFDKMMDIGAFYGRSKSKTNPLMKRDILATRSGFEIIDLQRTIECLEKAATFIEEKAKEDAQIIFVGTSPAAKSIVKKHAERLGLSYVAERWLGGTLTNFKTITERINYFRKLKEDKESGDLKRYTKKEQLQKDKELVKLDRLFGGISELKKLPSLMFIADLQENEFPAIEARKKNIPIIAIANTDSNPKLADYIIPANNRNSEVIEFVIEYLGEAIIKGQKEKEREKVIAEVKKAEEEEDKKDTKEKKTEE